MERKYTILSVLLIVLALGLVILPGKSERKEIEPKILLNSVTEKSRYLSVDLVTRRIIENDPTLLLVDLRPAGEFRQFSLPGSVNVQQDSLLGRANLELFREPGKDKVIYANSDLTAEMAWLLCARCNVDRIYIMKGGLNEWFTTIIKEQNASPTASTSDLELLNFRKAARQFFTGNGIPVAASGTAPASEKITITRKTPSATSGGGC
jgi:sulfur-carrier protein adenylyltransferase/sulfurtransferase